MTALTALTIAGARDGLKQKKFSAVELADAHLAAMEKARALNAYVLETPERAMAMAKASDARIAKGEAHPLEGIPLAVKDMFATQDVRTTAGSRILDNFVPTYESTVSAHLWRDGAVLLGKTNNDEFAMGSSNVPDRRADASKRTAHFSVRATSALKTNHPFVLVEVRRWATT